MKTIKIASIGNYVPRQCGIATFTRDVVESLIYNKNIKNTNVEAYVVAINDPAQSYEYPEIVRFVGVK